MEWNSLTSVFNDAVILSFALFILAKKLKWEARWKAWIPGFRMYSLGWSLKNPAGGLAVVGKTVLENATFKETEEYYSLIIPAEKAGDLVADLHLLDRVDLGIADVHDITVEGGQIVYNVDKTTRLVSSVELKNVDVRGKGVYKGVSADLLAPTNGTFRFSRYNELEESEYAIPEEILKAGSGKD